MILGPIEVSLSSTNVNGQKVLISTVISYGISGTVLDFSAFAQLRMDGELPYVLFNPVITEDYQSYEWEVSRTIGSLAFPHYIFFKNVVTNQGRFVYYLCPDNTKLLNPMLTLGNSTSLNINEFQGFDLVNPQYDYTPGILSGISKDLISISSVSGPKRITYVMSPLIFAVRTGVIPTSWTNIGLYRCGMFSIVPSMVLSRKDCNVQVKAIDIVARNTAGIVSTYCSENGYPECTFYSNNSICISSLTFSNCSKGIKCGTENCFGSCFRQDTECLFNGEFSCLENPPPQPFPPDPNPTTDYTYLIIGGIILFVIILVIILASVFGGSKKDEE